MKSKPSLSILLPVFNIGHYLPSCLDSLLESSYIDLEIIAIDDFSKDDSWKILRIYKSFDKRIRIYRNVKHYGKAITFNRLLKKAKGQFITCMDGKDIVYKNKFKRQIGYLHRNEKVLAIGSQCTFINSMGKKTNTSNFPIDAQVIYQRPLHGVSLDFETLMINTHNLPKDLLYFNGESSVMYSDIIMRLLQFGEIHNLSTILQYRRTENPHRKTTISKIPSLLKLWITSIDSYDYRPSLQAFLNSFRPNLS